MTDTKPVALITGGAKRIGACIAQQLHQNGFRVIIHYNNSSSQAHELVATFNDECAQTAHCLQADLNDQVAVKQLGQKACQHWQRLDLLVNNASSFYPTPFEEASEKDWQNLMTTNAHTPYFLTQAVLPTLRQNKGSIVNLADVHGQRPIKRHSIYCMSKAALIMLTQALAQELAPAVRVNAIAPGMILAPDNPAMAAPSQKLVNNRIPLQSVGQPEDIAQTVYFLSQQSYITGHILSVDGGRSLTI